MQTFPLPIGTAIARARTRVLSSDGNGDDNDDDSVDVTVVPPAVGLGADVLNVLTGVPVVGTGDADSSCTALTLVTETVVAVAGCEVGGISQDPSANQTIF